MADCSAEFSNPRKKIKLDDELSKAPSQEIADTEAITSSSENHEQEKSQASSPEASKSEDLSPQGGESDSDNSASALSDFSDLSGEESWKAQSSGAMSWVYRNMEEGVSPRSILEQIISDSNIIPNVDDFTLWKLVISIMSEPPPREKLSNINTIEDVIDLMQKCKKIMVLTGAGVSVSCGIPDFRSRNGVYARLAVDFPDLPDPQAMFDIHYFKNDQRPFFKFAKEIFPGQFEPSKCHKFIKLIETHGKLLRNYTQNIDTLEQVAGITNVIQCHGSFASATCMTCLNKCSGDDIKAQIMDQVIPMCPKCDPQTPLSVMKPDIVFFGESLPEEFHQQMSNDKDQCDLLIVIGSSLKVRPVALIPNSLPPEVPQILINKEPLRNLNFDVELLGDCDTIISELCRRLGEGWKHLARTGEPLVQISVDQLLTPPATPTETDKKQTFGKTPADPNKNQTSGEAPKETAQASISKVTPTNTDKTKSSQASYSNISTAKTQTSQITPTDIDKTKIAQASFSDKNQTCQATPIDTDKTMTSSSKADQSGDNIGSSGQSAMEVSCSTANADDKMATSGKETTEEKDMGTALHSLREGKDSLKEKGGGETSNCLVGSSECDSIGEASAEDITDRHVSSTQHGEQSGNTSADSSTPDGQMKSKDIAVTSATTSLNKFSGTLKDTAEDSIGDIDTSQSEVNCDSSSVDPGSEDITQTDTDTSKHSKAGPSTEPDLKSMWQPKYTKLSVAQRLGPNQYCLIPPHRYVFTEAEVFTMIGSDSDTDDSMGDLDDDDDEDDDYLEKDSSGIAHTLDAQESSSKTSEAADSCDRGDGDVTESRTIPEESLNQVTSTSETLSTKGTAKSTSMDTGEVDSSEKRESSQSNR